MVVEPLLAERLLAVTLSLMVGPSAEHSQCQQAAGDVASHLYMTFLCLFLASERVGSLIPASQQG